MLKHVFIRPLDSGHDRPFLLGDGSVSAITSSSETAQISRLDRLSKSGDWTFTLDISSEREMISWLRGVRSTGDSFDLWADHPGGARVVAEDCVLSSYSVPDQDKLAQRRFVQSAAVSARSVIFVDEKMEVQNADMRSLAGEAPGCVVDLNRADGVGYIALVVSPSGAADALRVLTSRNGVHWASSPVYGTFARPSDLAAYRSCVVGGWLYFVAAGKVYAVSLSSLIAGVTVRPPYVTPVGGSYGTLVGLGVGHDCAVAAFADGSYWRIYSPSSIAVSETHVSAMTCAGFGDDGAVIFAGGGNLVCSLPSGAALYGTSAATTFAVVAVGRNGVLSFMRSGQVSLSEDYGVTWRVIANLPGAVCAVRQMSRNVLFASVGIDCGATAMISLDGGYSWEMVDTGDACIDTFGCSLIADLLLLYGQVASAPAARSPNGFTGVAPSSASYLASI